MVIVSYLGFNFNCNFILVPCISLQELFPPQLDPKLIEAGTRVLKRKAERKKKCNYNLYNKITQKV